MPRPDEDVDVRTCVQNGVAVPTGTPEEGRDYRPDYEPGPVAALRRRVRRGDDVVVVGGGLGVTTVVAARMTGYEGTVTTFEASAEMVEAVEHTAEVNRVADLLTLRHAVVGPYTEEMAQYFGGPEGAERLDADAIPECDVLELDCEGAELAILRDLRDRSVRPRVVVVETHDHLGGPEDAVRDALAAMEYEVVHRSSEAPDDINVLTAVRE